MAAPAGQGPGAVTEVAMQALRARYAARCFSMRENGDGPELRFGELDGFVFEDGVDDCLAANLVLWLNRMLSSDRQAQADAGRRALAAEQGGGAPGQGGEGRGETGEGVNDGEG